MIFTVDLVLKVGAINLYYVKNILLFLGLRLQKGSRLPEFH
jgi:hypothetical protein